MAETGSRRRLARRLLLAGIGLFALFVALGFLAGPPILKARILREMGKRLGRPVTVGSVRVNPLELSARIRDLTILDRDGAVFASWEEAYVNYRFTSFLTRNFTFDDLSFEKPYARFVIEADGGLNIDDLLRIVRADPAVKSSGPPPVWSFQRVVVDEARVGFTDRTRTPAFQSTLGPFRLHLDRFSTSPASESPYSFRGSTESGESFSWSGRITSDPLRSSGQVALEGVRLPKYKPYYETGRPFQVRDGRISVSASYDVAWSAGERKLRVQDARLELTGAKIARPGAEAPDVEVARLTVEDADVDALAMRASIGKIALDGGHVLIRHDRDGKVNLYEMIRPFVESAPDPGAQRPAVSVGTLAITDVEVDAEDEVPERPFRVRADDVSFTMTGIDGSPETRCPATLSARFGDAGRVTAQGTFTSDFHAGDLDVAVEEVDVRPTDTYLAPHARVRLGSGKMGARGHVVYEMPPRGALEFRYTGDLTLRDLAVVHADTAGDLLRLAVLKLAPMDVRLNPMRIAVGEIAVGAPRLTVAVGPDRSIDLARAITVAEAPPASDGAKPGYELAIEALRLRDGSVRLTDRSIDPVVVTSISKIEGTIRGISSKDLEHADVDVAALFEGVAPMSVKGTINPIARKDFTDLVVSVRGIDLLPFSPYSGKYLGWTLAKGKMAAELKYRIAERRFKSDNLFTIEQVQLGTRTESPDALKVPVKLAVAVLRDRNGQIVLDVPAEGSVDDPELKLGRVIVRAIVNVLTKIATSPFRLLANAFGSPEENLEYQEFVAGSASLSDAERKKLDVVAKSLTERPDLSLDVAGGVDPVADAEALRRRGLAALVETRKRLADPGAAPVAVEEYARWLGDAYAAAFPGTPAPASTPDMEAKLLETIEVGPEQLSGLAGERARSVRDYLTTAGGVAPERVFLVELAAQEGREPAPRVWLELK